MVSEKPETEMKITAVYSQRAYYRDNDVFGIQSGLTFQMPMHTLLHSYLVLSKLPVSIGVEYCTTVSNALAT